MIVILHVIIACLSVGLASYSYARPSASMLRAAYGSIGLTLVSGLYLVWSAPAHMVQACTAGLIYISVVSVGVVAARTRLAAIKTAHR